MKLRIAAILLASVAGAASAQTQAPPVLDLQLPPARVDANAVPSTPDDYADASEPDSATSVHGSFTAGVGYSKAYGNSTFNSAELDVSKQYGDGKTIDMHFDVTRITGLPAVAPRCYGSPYCGY